MSEVRIGRYNDLYFKSIEFAGNRKVKPVELVADNRKFWEGESKNISWQEDYQTVLEGEAPFYRWFEGGKLNASYNCIDRHLGSWTRNKAAIVFEGEPGDQRVLTYNDLYREVSKFASVLKRMNVKKGDIVTIYMPMIPETIVAMLACARIGAPHSVVFGGFSSNALKDRINDSESKVVITVDGYWRRGRVVPSKTNVDKAVDENEFVENVIVVKRTKHHIFMEKDRDYWYDELMDWADRDWKKNVSEPEVMDSEDTLFLLYTSGTTGKPKGIVHTTGGYMTGVNSTFRRVFDIRDEDVYFCTADVGWITGHSYIVYGPLSHGSTVVIYEGAPNHPDKDRIWDIIEKYGVTILYTSPTAIRMAIKWGDEYTEDKDLSSLRLLGSVGEPINPEVWKWYFEKIGGERCPIVDTWWQTETGSIMISPIPGKTPLAPGCATKPITGVSAEVVDEDGTPVSNGGSGYLVVKEPWPSMLRNVYKNEERYVNTYWSNFEGMYFTGDGAIKDENGYIWVTGRVDDVINISGHRLGSAEVESAVLTNDSVAEVAAIGCSDSIKGSVICLFISLKEGVEQTDDLKAEIKEAVRDEIGKFASPEKIIFMKGLPKTRSGKIMRRILRNIGEGKKDLGDLSTLVDRTVVDDLIKSNQI
ncbi:acetyl-CoA synthetase [Dethiosulfatibacter aminovorans DSM 17477]|uniref:Acetate--CoA ligase n=1 Tax=Dethiosulfatibacter aminovorans DSM 17477 TaxID=1121476 RepID=A0A1M6ISP1_9FIRM|nr:acetate--CoA ligase [Dethiosulfatibacter aminovorans]SHJ37462.1 acetyl-CoA synthetase [Dethiosulfatibacter aminovorans DSM 17477]